MTAEYEVDPDVDTEIPGTDLIVCHGGDEEAYVHVEADGWVLLGSSTDWRVRLAS